jgi:hypothetical protein
MTHELAIAHPLKPSLWYFQRMLELGRNDRRHSVLSAIAVVEAVWSFNDADLSTFTYVVALRSGERAAIQYTRQHLSKGANESLTFRRLAKCAPLPPVDGDGQGWSLDIEHLNNYVAAERQAKEDD